VMLVRQTNTIVAMIKECFIINVGDVITSTVCDILG